MEPNTIATSHEKLWISKKRNVPKLSVPSSLVALFVEFKAAARAILWEDGKDPS
jgi:hypothetical protein